MENILIISTGGTFNKYYNPKDGSLEIEKSSKIIEQIFSHWLCSFKIIPIIGKDSLDMNNQDRENLLDVISKSIYQKIVVVHGTDTIDISSKFIADKKIDKQIIFTGSMTPFTIDNIEATANLSSAIGYIQAIKESGVYISLNGSIGDYKEVVKDRTKGVFYKK
jgi:L-asparaginase